jgi:biotin carboxyl carrier protein
MTPRKIKHGDDVLDVAWRRDRDGVVVLRDEVESAFAVLELAPGEYVLRRDGRQTRCIVAATGDERWIWIEGRVHRVRFETAGRKHTAPATGALVAPMPGQVLRVLVAAGDTVRKDQTLVVLEAMKMQYEIAAPRDGVVSEVNATAGAQVPGGVALVTLAEESA